MKNPGEYKTQTGLLKALNRVSEGLMDMKVAWWLQNCRVVLVQKWGWEEKQAAKYVAAYHPRQSGYLATGRC